MTPPAGLAALTTLTLVTKTVTVEVPVTGVAEFGGVPVARLRYPRWSCW